MVWYKKSNENAVLKIYQSAAKALLVKKRFKIFQNLVEVVKIKRFSKWEVQQVQTKNNSDSVEPCTATNANNFSSRPYNVPNSNSSSTKNSFSCQTLIVVVVVEKKCSDNISNSSSKKSRSYNVSNSSRSSREKSFLQSVKLSQQ